MCRKRLTQLKGGAASRGRFASRNTWLNYRRTIGLLLSLGGVKQVLSCNVMSLKGRRLGVFEAELVASPVILRARYRPIDFLSRPLIRRLLPLRTNF
jgi:hypothetical protein